MNKKELKKEIKRIKGHVKAIETWIENIGNDESLLERIAKDELELETVQKYVKMIDDLVAKETKERMKDCTDVDDRLNDEVATIEKKLDFIVEELSKLQVRVVALEAWSKSVDKVYLKGEKL